MAKGLGGGVPIGAVMADKKCQDVLGAGTHGTTFGGNPLCCAAANTVLDIVNKPEFLKSVQENGRVPEKGDFSDRFSKGKDCSRHGIDVRHRSGQR